MISTPFLIALTCTVLALVAVIWSGATRRRSLHYGLVVAMLGFLGWAIREAEIMGAQLVYNGAAGVFHTIHFGAVTVTSLAFPALVVTGVRLARRETPEHRSAHRTLAWVFVGCVLITTALGTAMTLLADVSTPGSPASSTPGSAGGGD